MVSMKNTTHRSRFDAAKILSAKPSAPTCALCGHVGGLPVAMALYLDELHVTISHRGLKNCKGSTTVVYELGQARVV
jgi:hypothetical protein